MVTVKDTFRNGLKIKDCPLLPRMERWVLWPKQSPRLRLENHITGREHVNTVIFEGVCEVPIPNDPRGWSGFG